MTLEISSYQLIQFENMVPHDKNKSELSFVILK